MLYTVCSLNMQQSRASGVISMFDSRQVWSVEDQPAHRGARMTSPGTVSGRRGEDGVERGG